MLANWLTTPPTHFVLHEPNLKRERRTRLTVMQLEAWGLSLDEVQARQWGVKEVEADKSAAFLERWQAERVILCVRDIREVALSLFEKHRRQGNLDTYPDSWASEYSVREAAGLVALAARLEQDGPEWRIARYEDFARSEAERAAIAAFVGWPGGGDERALLERIDRGFEGGQRSRRHLGAAETALADAVAEQCGAYQRRFGYR